MKKFCVVLVLLLVTACYKDLPYPDAGEFDAGPTVDAGSNDAGVCPLVIDAGTCSKVIDVGPNPSCGIILTMCVQMCEGTPCCEQDCFNQASCADQMKLTALQMCFVQECGDAGNISCDMNTATLTACGTQFKACTGLNP